MNKSDHCTVLLFDLGGVIIDIDFRRVFESWAGNSGVSLEYIASRFTFDEAYACHERGQITASEYFCHLRETLDVSLSDEKWLSGWNALFGGVIGDIESILLKARKRWALYAFSNTNLAHQKIWKLQFSRILEYFNEIYTSPSLGCRKPEPEAYCRVCQLMDVPQHEVMFFDDSLNNVLAAQECGINAVCVRKVGDIWDSLWGTV